jgi:RNA polymerase sigma-70 factor (ECF subfamily)
VSATTVAPATRSTVDQLGLVERARDGDHDAFTALARDAIARLDAAARLVLRDADLSRDAVQDALLRAWRGLPGLRDPGRFDAWLYRLTMHACLDLARRRQRRSIEVELYQIAGPSVSDIAGDVADRDLLDGAMSRLTPNARAVIVLHYYLGMPLPEVANALEIPVGTAKSRLNRALERMRSTIDGDTGTTTEPYPGGQLA